MYSQCVFEEFHSRCGVRFLHSNFPQLLHQPPPLRNLTCLIRHSSPLSTFLFLPGVFLMAHKILLDRTNKYLSSPNSLPSILSLLQQYQPQHLHKHQLQHSQQLVPSCLMCLSHLLVFPSLGIFGSLIQQLNCHPNLLCSILHITLFPLYLTTPIPTSHPRWIQHKGDLQCLKYQAFQILSLHMARVQ